MFITKKEIKELKIKSLIARNPQLIELINMKIKDAIIEGKNSTEIEMKNSIDSRILQDLLKEENFSTYNIIRNHITFIEIHF